MFTKKALPSVDSPAEATEIAQVPAPSTEQEEMKGMKRQKQNKQKKNHLSNMKVSSPDCILIFDVPLFGWLLLIAGILVPLHC